MLDIWVGLTNANRREIGVIDRAHAMFEFAYMNSAGNGNPVFKNVAMIHFNFPVGWASPPGFNWVKGALFSTEQDGYAFFDSPLEISGLTVDAGGINFDIGELCFEVIGISDEERDIYVAMEQKLLDKANANPPPPVIVSKVELEDTKYVCAKCFTNYCDCKSPAFIPLAMAKQKKKEKKEANAKAAAKHVIMVDNGEKIIKQIKKDFAAATKDNALKSFDDIKGEVSTVFEAANDLGIMLDTALLTWLDDNLKFK